MEANMDSITIAKTEMTMHVQALKAETTGFMAENRALQRSRLIVIEFWLK